MLRMGSIGTRHPQTGAAGIPEAARAFTCVNLLRGSGLDFPCVRPVIVRKREDRSGRASRKHVDFAGLPDRSCERAAHPPLRWPSRVCAALR